MAGSAYFGCGAPHISHIAHAGRISHIRDRNRISHIAWRQPHGTYNAAMSNGASSSEMPTRVLGHTGERVSLIGLGGWHLGLPRVDEALAIRLVRSAIDRGLTFMDNCWDYNDGLS